MDSFRRFGSVIGEAATIARRSSGWLVFAAIVLTVTYMAADVLVPPPRLAAAYGALGFMSLYLELLLTARMLSVSGLADYRFDPRAPTDGRYASAFLLSLMTVLGIAVGLILLVIPGLVLLARWSICFVILLAERATVSESLNRSWRMTGRHWRVATLVTTAVILMWLWSFIAAFLLYPDYDPPALGDALLVNVLSGLARVGTWLLSVAFYVWMRRADAGQGELADDRS